MRSKSVRQAAKSSSRPPGGASPDAEEREQAGLDPAPARRGLGSHSAQAPRSAAGSLRVVVLAQARPPANHLGERPEGAPAAVGGGAAGVPVDGLDDAVEVLLQLPGEPRLADPGLADDRDEPRPPVAAGGVEAVLEEAELVVAADERRLDDASGPPAALAHDAHGAEGGHRRRLALQDVVAGRLEDDGRPDRPARRLADEDGPGGATAWSRDAVLTRSPADHALALARRA